MALLWSDLIGTVSGYLRLGLGTGVRLANSSGALSVRNAVGNADAAITASQVNVSGDVLVLNSDAAGSGADRTFTIQRAVSGMGAAVTLTLPVDDGSPNQVLTTDGSGVLSWTSSSSTASSKTVDTTTIAFGDASPVSAFTLPANAVVDEVEIIVDTPFVGTAPTMTVGITGSAPAKYHGTTDNDLTAAAGTSFTTHPSIEAAVTTEAIAVAIGGTDLTVGSVRVLVTYSVPA